MPDDNKKRAAQRARAFRNGGYSPPMSTLIDKVATRPTQITGEDFAAAKKALFTEDQLRTGGVRRGR